MTDSRQVNADVEAIVEHKFAELEDVRLHYVEANPEGAELVILLHGFPEFWYTWRNQIPALANAGFHVVAPDMRGYNLSEKPAKARFYGSDYLSRDVAALIQHLGREKAHVVGHDWGAVVAWLFAMRYPDHLGRLVTMNGPHPGCFFKQILTSPKQWWRSSYILAFQIRGLAEYLFRRHDFAVMRKIFRTEPINPTAFTAADIDRYVEAARRPGAVSAMLNYYRQALREMFGKPAISLQTPVTNPSLVLWGLKDNYLGSHIANVPDWLAPNLKLSLIDNASHWIQVDQAEAVNNALLDFLTTPNQQLSTTPDAQDTDVDGDQSESKPAEAVMSGKDNSA